MTQQKISLIASVTIQVCIVVSAQIDKLQIRFLLLSTDRNCAFTAMQWHNNGGVWGLQPPLLEPQMTSYLYYERHTYVSNERQMTSYLCIMYLMYYERLRLRNVR